MRSLTAAFLPIVLSHPAFAACPSTCDADGDGYSPTPGGSCSDCPGVPDCDDGDQAVNPSAAEVIDDWVDDDCDDSTLIHRTYISGMDVNVFNDFAG